MLSVLRTLRVGILDLNPATALGFATYLDRNVGCRIVGGCSDPKEFLRLVKSPGIDLALIDFFCRSKNVSYGCEVVNEARVTNPELKVILTTNHSQAIVLRATHGMGVSGIYQKSEKLDRLITLLDAAYLQARSDGEPSRWRRMGGENSLSPGEASVLIDCLNGLSVAEIAKIKGKSIKTVSRQKRLAYQKLGIANDFELFRDERLIGMALRSKCLE